MRLGDQHVELSASNVNNGVAVERLNQGLNKNLIKISVIGQLLSLKHSQPLL